MLNTIGLETGGEGLNCHSNRIVLIIIGRGPNHRYPTRQHIQVQRNVVKGEWNEIWKECNSGFKHRFKRFRKSLKLDQVTANERYSTTTPLRLWDSFSCHNLNSVDPTSTISMIF